MTSVNPFVTNESQDRNDFTLFSLGILGGIILTTIGIFAPNLLGLPQIISVVLGITLIAGLSLALVRLMMRSKEARDEGLWTIVRHAVNLLIKLFRP